jgi:cystathionine gamma-synthase
VVTSIKKIDPTWDFQTLAVHAGHEPDESTGAVVPAINTSTTFQQDGVGRPRNGWEYARTNNPTRERLETALSQLEGAPYAIAVSSGVAAAAMAAELVGPGEQILSSNALYGGTYRLFERVLRARGVDTVYADLTGDWWAASELVNTKTRAIWFESPTNPTLRLVDIGAVSDRAAHIVGARGEKPLVIVDGTFATPAVQRPLALGADIVFHSTSKYLSGHSDVVGGVLVTTRADIAERLRFLQNAMGAIPSPFDCYLTLRGLRTFALRMDRHSENATQVAWYLCKRTDLAEVIYPGIDEGPHAHPQAGLARMQMSKPGGVVSFRPSPGGRHNRSARERAEAICEAVKLFTYAESLGAVESLIGLSARMSHPSMTGSTLAVSPELVRVSCGIEASTDLIADLRQAIDSA